MSSLPLAPILYLLAAATCGTIVWCFWSIAQGAREDFHKTYRVEGEASWSDILSTLSPNRLYELSLLTGGCAFLLGDVAVNIFAGAVLGGGGFLLPRAFTNYGRDKRRALFATQLLDALSLLSNSVRAGMTLPQAVELVVREMHPPVTQEFGSVLQEYRLGADFDDAMKNMARRLDNRDVDMLVNATVLTRESGGNLSEVFAKISDGIRERSRIEGKVRALSATGKMQAVVMSAMPFGIVVIMYFMDPEHVKILFSTPLGLLAVGVVLALQVVAFLWISSLTSLDV